MAFTQKRRFSVFRPHRRGWMRGNQESICCSPRKPPAEPRCLTERQLAKRVEQLSGFFGDTFSWMFHGQGVHFSPAPVPDCSKAFTLFFLSCSNQALISKLSLIGQNRLFGWCGSACPQNVPPLCHSKDWEDAAGCGHNEEGRGWHRLEKEKPWAPKAGSYKEHSHMS